MSQVNQSVSNEQQNFSKDITCSSRKSGKRIISVSSYKNIPFIDIREYYKNKNNEHCPGKKGITLKLEELLNIIENIDQIKEAYENIICK